MSIITYFDLAGIAIVAISGTLVAARKGVDLFGAIVFAVVTGVGGGTLRDILLDVPVFWIQAPSYLLVASGAGLASFFWIRFCPIPPRAVSVTDAFALAMFAVMGCSKTLDLGFSPVIAVVMGTLTGVAGGMVRDLLAGEIPFVFRGELYATAAIAGSIVFAVCFSLEQPTWISAAAGAATVLTLRLAAIRWRLSLPQAFSVETKQPKR